MNIFGRSHYLSVHKFKKKKIIKISAEFAMPTLIRLNKIKAKNNKKKIKIRIKTFQYDKLYALFRTIQNNFKINVFTKKGIYPSATKLLKIKASKKSKQKR